MKIVETKKRAKLIESNKISYAFKKLSENKMFSLLEVLLFFGYHSMPSQFIRIYNYMSAIY